MHWARGATLVLLVVLLVVPQTASMLVDNRPSEPTKDYSPSQSKWKVLTEHGTLEYLGGTDYIYSTVLGETNTYYEGAYQPYVYNATTHSVDFAEHTLTLYDWYAVFENESQVLIDDMRWAVEYWDAPQWRTLDLWQDSYLPVIEGATLLFGQHYNDTESTLDVWYNVRNNDQVKATLNLTAANAGEYRFVWQLTGVDGNPVPLNKSVQFDDVNIGWGDAELNASYEWTAASKKCDIIFDNFTLDAGESYILDPSVHPVLAAGTDDCWWWLNDTDDANDWTQYNAGAILQMRQYLLAYQYVAEWRFQLNIPQGSSINSANFSFYESTDQGTRTFNISRVDEDNAASPEGRSGTPPTIDYSVIDQFTFNGVASEWGKADITNVVQNHVDQVGFVSGYYMGLWMNDSRASGTGTHFQVHSYENAGATEPYLNISYTEPEDEYDYVDQTSNEDASADIGTHSSFAAQQAGPDDTFDSMTEANTGGDGQNVHDFVDQVSSLHDPADKGTHDVFGDLQDYGSNYDQMQEANQGGGGVDEFRFIDSADLNQWTGVGTPPYMDAQDEPTNYIWTGGNGDITGWSTFADTSGTGSGFTVNLWVYHRSDGDGYPDWELDWTGDGTADASGSCSNQATYAWQDEGVISGLDTQAEIDATRLRLTNNKGAGGPDDVFVDAVRLEIYKAGVDDYELDLEIGWTAADYDNAYEFLCIYPVTGGGWPSEDLKVDVWSGSWTNVISDLTPDQWNNVSIKSYLTGNAFEMRFLGGTEDGDSTQDTFEIDAVLLHTWNDVANYSLDLEEQWTNVNYTRSNEELCIYMNTTDAENIKVQVWNSTESTWHDLFSDLIAGQWNNISVTASLTSAEFTIRFIDTDRTNDTNQDVWKKDCTLLHTWEGAQELSVTVSELIGIFDSTTPSADYHLSINELIDMSESVSVGLIYTIIVLEIISLAAFVSTTLMGGVNIFESIGLAAVTTTSVSLSTTINEVINLSDTVLPYMATHYTSYEVLPLSDITNTTLNAGVAVLESIPLADSIATVLSASVNVLESIPLFDSVSTVLDASFTSYEIINLSDSVALVVKNYVSVFEVIPFSDTTTTTLSAGVTILESIPLADTVATTLSAVVEVFESILVFDSVIPAMSLYASVFELLPISEGISTTLNAAITVLESIPLADTVATTLSAVVNVFESIPLFDVTTTTVGGAGEYFVTVYEIIGFSDTASTVLDASVTVLEIITLSDTVIPAMSLYVAVLEVLPLSDITTVAWNAGVTVLESLPLSDTISTTLSAGVTVLESIPLADSISTTMAVSTNIFEIIPFFDSVIAEINPSISLVIYEIIPIESVVVAVGGPDTTGIFYLLFLSREMWGYLGPAALVIGGYIVTKKNKTLGVLWFIVICLVIGEYLNFVTASPQYWWHIYILLLGGLFTCVYPLWGDRY